MPKERQPDINGAAAVEALSRALEGSGFGQRLVGAVESLRPGTRQLTDGQETVLLEYAHVVDVLSPPSFSPPAPEISEFQSDGGKVRIYGKHLRQPIAVTVAGVRVTHFAFMETEQDGGGEPPHIEAAVPSEAATGPIIVLTSGGSATSRSDFRAAASPGDAAGAADA